MGRSLTKGVLMTLRWWRQKSALNDVIISLYIYTVIVIQYDSKRDFIWCDTRFGLHVVAQMMLNNWWITSCAYDVYMTFWSELSIDDVVDVVNT